jgi:hypothetical protein
VSAVRQQYDPAPVTQPRVLAQGPAWGVERAAGPRHPGLTAGQERLPAAQAAVKAPGLAVARYVPAAATGARQPGQQGYCTYRGTALVAGCARTAPTRRVTVLEVVPTARRSEGTAEALP